ncbi:MAG: metalloregulator ArsR/SmtB family transcription factor [Alphaproteobacteria bacterium]|nr:metalloregulator ArsR/SmtB family transcription factor [Alphaproteobacteria bacterium]
MIRPVANPLPALSDDDAARLADMFRLLGDPSRLRIVLACIAGPVSVGAIAERVGLSLSLVSHHLRLLRAARLVKATRQGKQVFYAAADDHVRCVIADMVSHVGEGPEQDEREEDD